MTSFFCKYPISDILVFVTELSDRLQREIQDGRSLREIGRKAGLSATTIGKVLAGKEIDRSTIEKLSGYLHLPIEEVYRMAGFLPPMYEDGILSRGWMLSKLWEVLSRLTEADQALVLAEAIRLNQKYKEESEAKRIANQTRTENS